MSVLCQMFASGGNPSQLDLANPLLLKALTPIVNTYSKCPSSPPEVFTLLGSSTHCTLFPGTAAPQSTSPSVHRYLTNVTSSVLPSYYGPLDFLDTQALFDDVILPTDQKPIFSLHTPPTSNT